MARCKNLSKKSLSHKFMYPVVYGSLSLRIESLVKVNVNVYEKINKKINKSADMCKHFERLYPWRK